MLLPHLPILRYPLPDDTLPVVVSFVFPTSHQSSFRYFSFRRFSSSWYAMCIGYLVSYWRALPRSTSVFWHVQSRLWPCLFSTQMFVCQSLYVKFNILLSIFVYARLACSLHGWWVPICPRCMSLMKLHMNCRCVSSSTFRCYPWIRGAWRMLFTRLRVYNQYKDKCDADLNSGTILHKSFWN